MPRRFELSEGKSEKFWEISQRGKRTKVCFGRIGSAGQVKEKEHTSTADAKDAMASLIAQKIKKGYQETDSTTAKRTSRKKNAATPKRKAKTRSAATANLVVDSASAIPKNETLTFIGLIDPALSGGGLKSGRAKPWTFAGRMIAWRVVGGPVVREPIDVISSKIGDRKLSTLMKQFNRWGTVKFTAERARRQQRMKTTVELKKFLGTVRDSQLAKVKKELAKPVDIKDRTFGTIKHSRENCLFEGELKHKGEGLYLWLETESIDEVKEMIAMARPLWRNRVKWFKDFQAFVLEETFDTCNGHRDFAEEPPLTQKEFLRLLGQPVGLSFRLDDGELEYTMSGYAEDLFSDHGVDVCGTLNDGLIEMG